MLSEFFTLLKTFLFPGLLGLAWVAYVLWGVKWLRGIRRARLF